MTLDIERAPLAFMAPGRIGRLVLKNRVIRAATSETMATESGDATPELVKLYADLAQGGAGLIITGHIYVEPRGQYEPRQVGLDHDSRIGPLTRVTDAVHRYGSVIFAELSHAGSQSLIPGIVPLAPSVVPNAIFARPPQEMTDRDIANSVSDFAAAAARAKGAGFDGVHLHSGNGYLLSQFNSPFANRRTDAWGGDPERRARFLLDVYRAVRRAVGADFPVTARLGVADAVDGGLALAAVGVLGKTDTARISNAFKAPPISERKNSKTSLGQCECSRRRPRAGVFRRPAGAPVRGSRCVRSRCLIILQEPLDVVELLLRTQHVAEAVAQFLDDAARALHVDLAGYFDRVVVAVVAPAQRTAERVGVLLRARLAEPAAAAGTGTLSHLLLHRLRQTLRALAQGMIERNAGLPPRRIEFGVARPDFQGAQGSARGCPAPRSPSKPWLTTRPSPRCGGSLRRPRKFRGWKRRPEGTVGRGRQLRVGISHAPVGPFLFLSLFYGNICNPRLRCRW